MALRYPVHHWSNRQAEQQDILESWTLSQLRQSFERQTPEQRQATVERVQRLLESERDRDGMHSYLWRHSRRIYGVDSK